MSPKQVRLEVYMWIEIGGKNEMKGMKKKEKFHIWKEKMINKKYQFISYFMLQLATTTRAGTSKQ